MESLEDFAQMKDMHYKDVSGCCMDTRTERAGVEAGDQLGGSCPKKRQW